MHSKMKYQNTENHSPRRHSFFTLLPRHKRKSTTNILFVVASTNERQMDTSSEHLCGYAGEVQPEPGHEERQRRLAEVFFLGGDGAQTLTELKDCLGIVPWHRRCVLRWELPATRLAIYPITSVAPAEPCSSASHLGPVSRHWHWPHPELVPAGLALTSAKSMPWPWMLWTYSFHIWETLSIVSHTTQFIQTVYKSWATTDYNSVAEIFCKLSLQLQNQMSKLCFGNYFSLLANKLTNICKNTKHLWNIASRK